MKKINQKGFTLIELLVVIAIIGLLSTMAVVSLNNARIKARDARRISDIKQIQTALEMYFTDNNEYPGAGNTAASMDALQTSGYMADVPENALPNGSAYTYQVCTSGTDPIVCDPGTVVTGASRSSYTLTYELEGGGGGMLAGDHCATPAGIDSGTDIGTNCIMGTDESTPGI